MKIPKLAKIGSRTDVRDKVVVITGGARGIGADAARQLYERGAYVALLDRDALVADTAAALGERAFGLTVDVTDLTGLEKAMTSIVERFGGIDVIVANAGIIGPSATVAAMEPATFDQVIEINLLGVYRTVRAALPHVVERQGYVLVVASMAAAIPMPTFAAYGASKAGADAFAHALRLELASTGTQVGVAYFGVIETDMLEGMKAHQGIMGLLADTRLPIGKTVPVSEAGAAILRGVERRSSRVIAPRYVSVLVETRGMFDHFDKLLGRHTALARAIESADNPAGTSS